jgi:hypothetical protein
MLNWWQFGYFYLSPVRRKIIFVVSRKRHLLFSCEEDKHKYFCRGKVVNITCYKCVTVALVIQHAVRLCLILFVVYLAVPYFLTLSHKRQYFREKVIEYKMCLFILSSTLTETFLILRRIRRDTTRNEHGFSCNILVSRVSLELNLIFSTDFLTIPLLVKDGFAISWNY